MRNDLLGRVALVTGGSRGIGRAIALELARVGADIAINYHSNDQAAREVCLAIQQGGRRALQVQADVSRAEEVANMVATIRLELGPVAILVNNAGIANLRSIEEISEADWDETQAVNLKGPFLVSQAVLPDMRVAKWGRIISISSVAAQTGGVVGLHYASSKAGILGLMHYYASHLAKEGITANSIAPGAVRTDMAANLSLRPDAIPVGRLGTPEEIADVAVMLACNGYITGQTINLNGGRYPS